MAQGKAQYQPFTDFYVPTYREEYFRFLTKKYPTAKPSFRRMSFSKLKAIYLAIRTRRG